MNIALPITVLILYLASGILFTRRLTQGVEAQTQSKRVPMSLGLAAVALHGWLVERTILTPAGADLAFFNMLSLVMGLVAMLVLLSSLIRPVENLGIVVLPIAGLAVALQAFLPEHPDILEDATTGIRAHILFSLLGYSLLGIGAVQAVLLAVQDRHLRNRHPGGFIRALPPLETMESLLFQVITLGYVLLIVGLITGFIFLEDIFAQHLVHKTVLSLVAWAVFTVLLWGRWRFGWRGRTAIRWTLGGFIALMLAYFGSKMVLEFILGR